MGRRSIFSGGTVFESTGGHPIAGTHDPQLYQSRREGPSTYDIPLRPGMYELRLYFGETLYGDNNIAGGGETSRIFQMSANGDLYYEEFDVIADVGPALPTSRFSVTSLLQTMASCICGLIPGTNPAFLNGIEIVPGIRREVASGPLVSRDRGLRDKSGRSWEPIGMSKAASWCTKRAAARPHRSGTLPRRAVRKPTYTIPVVPGRYGLKLYFVESWFGPGRPGGGGEGSRVFDILCNGVALKRNFDIFKEAGGPNGRDGLLLRRSGAGSSGQTGRFADPAA